MLKNILLKDPQTLDNLTTILNFEVKEYTGLSKESKEVIEGE